MTIECTACHARYTIADGLVPPQGARVKCRKCAAVFLVKPETVVTPEALPVVPASPEPAPPRPAPPSDRADRAPTPDPAPTPAPALRAEPVAPVARTEAPAAPAPTFSFPTTPEPAAVPAADRAGVEPDAPSSRVEPPPVDHGFDRFPTQAPAPVHAPASEFERFPQAPAVGAAGGPTFVEPTHATVTAPAPTPPAPPPAPSAPSPPPPAPRATAPAAPAPPAPTGAAPTAPAPVREEARPRISATTLPDGLSPEELQRHERARRLARVLASDIAIYNREKRERGIRDGNLVAVLGYEIKKSWETYKERVGADFANSTPYFRDALNEIVAEGKKIF